MNFQKLLEYQRYDMAFDALDRELNSGEENDKRNAINQQFNEAVKTIFKLNDEAGALLGEFASVKQRLEECSRELEDLSDIFEENKDLDDVDATEMDHYLKQARKLRDKIESLEAELKTVRSKAAAAIKEYDEVSVRGTKLKERKAIEDGKYNERIKAYLPRFKEIKAKMEELRKQLPEEMALYDKTKAAVKKGPYIFAYDPKTKKCPYALCQMDIYANTQAKLKQPGDHAECPNCGRILFVAKPD